MPEATNSIEIHRSTAEVFAFLADGANDPRWRSGVLDIRLKSGRARVGPGDTALTRTLPAANSAAQVQVSAAIAALARQRGQGTYPLPCVRIERWSTIPSAPVLLPAK
jgi:hypothetical protein